MTRRTAPPPHSSSIAVVAAVAVAAVAVAAVAVAVAAVAAVAVATAAAASRLPELGRHRLRSECGRRSHVHLRYLRRLAEHLIV